MRVAKTGVRPLAGSEAFFTGLYEKHHRAVLAYCLRRTNDADARDATAEVFTVAWRRIEDLPDEELVLPWLYGVARRILSRQYRSTRRLRRLVRKLGGVGTGSSPDPVSEMVMRWEYRTVREALDRLKPAQREVLLLAAWEDLSNDEIGVALGCSTQAAAQRVHRAKKQLGRTFRALAARPAQPPLTTEGGEGR